MRRKILAAGETSCSSKGIRAEEFGNRRERFWEATQRPTYRGSVGSGIRGDHGAFGPDYDVGTFSRGKEWGQGQRDSLWAGALAHLRCSSQTCVLDERRKAVREGRSVRRGRGHSDIARTPAAPKRKLIWRQGFLSLQTSHLRSHFQAFSVFHSLLPAPRPGPVLGIQSSPTFWGPSVNRSVGPNHLLDHISSAHDAQAAAHTKGFR